ncbi:hypothetical protein MATL_G00017360 [Megalops atlanticus]|uniref:FBX41/ZN365 C2H2-type zinc finger domain-containing protein n=1 Tax=Megalops atlanticus TaxID=7932 RepID=A0A9D3TK59_MEGAT|nr:hypothetical protein MATL_G00017360 [Megalops atlanticus]
MQQKPNERKALLCTDIGRPCGVALLQLAFHCPRCGERQRFRSLSSLKVHLDYSRLYYTADDFSPVSRQDVGDVLLNHKKARDADCTENCKSSPVKKQVPAGSTGRGGVKFKADAGLRSPQGPNDGVTEEGPEEGCAVEPAGCRPTQSATTEACVQQRLEETLRSEDSPIERRLQEVSMELLQKEAELLHVHARSRHLAQEKQEVFERERALCRQVDTAVMVIGSLREHLRESERELERKEQEVITIHNFLEAAAQQEMCGKVRLQRFIENLLRRIALAEMLLEYYQSGSGQTACQNHTTFHTAENEYPGMTESWQFCSFRFSEGPDPPAADPETTGLPAQKGWCLSKTSRGRLGSRESCSHSDQVSEMWNRRRTSEVYED